MAKHKEDPSSTSAAYDIMLPRWKIIDDVLGGTESMRAASQEYMPRHEAETNLDYNERLSTAVLTNRLEQTLDMLSGKPFSQPVKLIDVPVELADLADDIDMLGSNLTVFCHKWFRGGLAKGFFHVLVDIPKPVREETEDNPRTREDDISEGRRPFWTLIDPRNILYARNAVVNGVEQVVHVRILETQTESDGFIDVEYPVIKVIEPRETRIYREDKSIRRGNKWKVIERYDNGLDFVPLVTFYATRDDFMLSKPPLLDLAYLNIAHWQSSSDQHHILTVTRYPMLAGSGVAKTEGDGLLVGPKQILATENPDGKFYYVEHTGAAISAGERDINRIDNEMLSYGMEFLKEKPDRQTASARVLDSSEASSDLLAMIGVFEDAVAIALSFTARIMNASDDNAGGIELVRSVSMGATENGLTALKDARVLGDISRKQYLEGLRQRGILRADFDFSANDDELSKEPKPEGTVKVSDNLAPTTR